VANPYEIYDLLQDYSASPAPVDEILIGLVWTYCGADAAGLAMSPGIPTRTLPWPGTLKGKTIAELAAWVRDFEPYRATIGMAAANAGINRLNLLPDGFDIEPQAGAANNLAVFAHFLPDLENRRVVVIGRYPGLDRWAGEHGLDLTVLERNPAGEDLPDPAAEYLLPEAEWVFITASAIPNKTFPRLAELSRNAVSVLMGPTAPWLPELYHFGIDYLAGVEIADAGKLRTTVAEGGGVRIFDEAVRYRVAPLNRQRAADWTQRWISRTVAEKNGLSLAMEAWYAGGQSKRFPQFDKLEAVQRRLSRLDTCFKILWDPQDHAKPGELER
jgi:uncharacterized protein (DUF4213/DUF364 family)